MNIEQIAVGIRDLHWLDMSDEAAITLLRHALSKLAEQDVEPVGYFFQHEDTGRMMSVDVQQVEWGFEKNNPRLINCGKLYTETQLLAAQQRTAEACAKVCNSRAAQQASETREDEADKCADSIRNGDWREYL